MLELEALLFGEGFELDQDFAFFIRQLEKQGDRKQALDHGLGDVPDRDMMAGKHAGDFRGNSGMIFT